MATSPIYSWPEPDDTSLVKNGALAMRTLGNAIDTTMATMVPKSIVDAKGDLIGATANDTPARLAVGTNGQVLTADSTAATGLAWATASSGASVNLLLNSNFALNQRAYVSAANLASGTYGFDRWKSNYTNTTLTFTASTQGQSLTINASGGLQQVIEQGLVPAGTYTLSWTGTATARVYNSGGTPPSYAASPVTFTADGTANVVVEFTAVSTTKTVSKVQFNAGTGTTWSLATPTLETELAACQRYYWRTANLNQRFGLSFVYNTTTAYGTISYPVTMRTSTITLETTGTAGNYGVFAGASTFQNTSVPSLDISTTTNMSIGFTNAGTMTAGQAGFMSTHAGAVAYLGFNGEL
jgi:hypothetical protein